MARYLLTYLLVHDKPEIQYGRKDDYYTLYKILQQQKSNKNYP